MRISSVKSLTLSAPCLRTGDLPQEDRDYLKRAVAARTNLSEAEVNARVDEAVKSSHRHPR